MIDVIRQKLLEIEQKENVKILYCVESGSRAWGFASPDSDYDVRFVYVRPLEYYLRLEKTRDVIEWQLDETLDINGWDLQKALRLLHNSNLTVFEWNSSPIVYLKRDEWEKVSAVINNYFRKKAGLYHYLSTAKKNYREYLKGDTVRYKKYFYVLRPILACKWIMEFNSPPPMLFSELAEKYIDGDLKLAVEQLLDIKMNTPEKKTGKKINIINDYIESTLAQLDNEINSLPADEPQGFEELNEIFLDFVTKCEK